ncbi:type II toxin-antitoxin system prevent-host-death family antitoxin [Rickettsiella endosymbiont of Rhagonycha lignosa]|uniref:type II toxin-antitoxin system Phd/YefM family antitoxin n=1 Tax=Rickettsiella endosymbiont of Rhagonycha lignosa TaxID=3077937 RepID=UPI00313B8DEA
MQTVGAFEAKTHFSALLDKVEKGEQIVITKHGRVVGKLVPATAANHLRIQQAISALKDLSHGHTLKSAWKKFRDAGRR